MNDKKTFVFILLPFFLLACQHKEMIPHCKIERRVLLITPTYAELITKKNVNADGFDVPFLWIHLTVLNASDKKVLYTCKAFATNQGNNSRMFIVNDANGEVPLIAYIDAFGVDLIQPHQSVKINARVENAALLYLLKAGSNVRPISDAELLKSTAAILKSSFLIYIPDQNDLVKYRHFFGKDVYATSDTISLKLLNVPIKLGGK